MATISSYPFTIQPENVDFTLRASVASIISYMLNVAGTDAHRKGFGVEALQGHSFTWVLSRLAVDINTQPRQYSNIEIDTWVNEFNRLSSTRNFKMRIGEDVIAAGVSQWCMLNMETRQAVDMTQLKDIYERAMVAEPSPITAPARLRDIEPQASVSRPVVYSDIDFNRHVNTLRYIDLIFDSLPIELIEKNNGMRLDINFIAEALYGEVLTIGWTSEGNVWQFEISSDSGKKLCRAKIEFK
ncbi:MAG: acyl-ACP thioesterase [Alistipes sp.]|jgi:acyl-ACP thioesterase|nr:acyl-ACP thioesterase [Alistipes sp.]